MLYARYIALLYTVVYTIDTTTFSLGNNYYSLYVLQLINKSIHILLLSVIIFINCYFYMFLTVFNQT